VGVFMAACSEKTETNTATNTSPNSSEEKTTANELYAELQKASEEGNLEKVRQLIKQGANVNLLVWDKTSSKNENDIYASYQETPLMLASKKGHLDVVKELLAVGANVNQILPIHTEREMMPGEAQTALEMSCRLDNMDVVKALASAGTDTQSVLICACLHGDEELLQIALQKKPNLNFTTGEGGVSPFIMAAEKGYTNIVKALLEAGADPNYTDPFIESDYTALQAAKDYPEIIELLKQAEAKETNIQTANLPKQDELDEALIEASRIGNHEEVKKLLAAGANANAKDEWGKTALMQTFQEDYSIAVPGFNYEKVQDLLLEAGADVNAADEYGQTALIMASYVGDVDSVKKLLDAGANVNAKYKTDGEENNALVWACVGMDSTADYDEKNKNQIVELLLNAKADQKEKALIAAIDSNFPVIVKTLLARGINTKGKSGEELLRVASQAGMLELVKMLLANKVNVNAVDEQGRTALLQATRPCGTGICDDRVGVAKALLEAGADVNLANKDGQTPLFYAIYSGDTEMVQLLLEAGADVTVKMKDGETVLQRAQKEEYNEIIKLLKAAGAKE